MLENLLAQVSAFIAAHPVIAVAIGVFLYFAQSPIVTKLPANLQKFVSIVAALLDKLDLDPDDETPESAADKIKAAIASTKPAAAVTSGATALSELAADLARRAIADGNIEVAKCISDHVLPALAGGSRTAPAAASEAH